MSTLRKDPTTGSWVILAPERESRPHAKPSDTRRQLPEYDTDCPFCPGNEQQTPPEILRVPASGPWRVRVIPNLYGVLGGDGSTERTGAPMMREMPGIGSSEVVVETPRHDQRLDEVDGDGVATVIRVWRDRYSALISEPGIHAVVVFKNEGPLAGTSLEHSHSQIVAVPVPLPRMLHRMDIATAYYVDTGHSLYDDLVDAERKEGTRIVAETDHFVVLEPFASGSPFETWILPSEHQGSFSELRDEDIQELAILLKRTLAAVREVCGDPDYNLVLSSAPSDGQSSRVFIWHFTLLPRLSAAAGFELGSGISVNTVPPEEAAEKLMATMRS
ncbi:MAG: galactose-1-phosphate uridylyltransferase [Actinomycetota bacterium]